MTLGFKHLHIPQLQLSSNLQLKPKFKPKLNLRPCYNMQRIRSAREGHRFNAQPLCLTQTAL